MKTKRRCVSVIMALILILNFSMFGAMQASAHSAMLDIAYDDCEAEWFDDGINEMWYALDLNEECQHLSHEEYTIKYYFKENFSKEEYTWATDVSESVAQEIKSAYASSMEKWNNVYFYSYNADGIVTKHRLINVVEGTEEDHNLLIIPIIGVQYTAGTAPIEESDSIIETGDIEHKHWSEWYMIINIDHFYENNANTAIEVNKRKEYTGAHELGHVLGLRDVDVCCDPSYTLGHHEELLMGYGISWSDITYKDIAGVAITRGFHTDDDHQWLSCGLQPDGKYKWLCAICNGTKEATNPGFFPSYGSCGNNHNLADGNMMAVASYGTKDYYKCKYCKYVAPFDNIVEQNYVASEYIDATKHKSVNAVAGLAYAIHEPHSYDDYAFVDSDSHTKTCACGNTITEGHTYDECVYKDARNHTATCKCGYQQTLSHWVKPTSERYANCVGCGALIDLGGTITPTNPFNITKVSVNGSYILPNGIAVIVDADVEAYLNGTLVFYDPDDLPVTQ